MAGLLNFSPSTVERRLRVFDLSLRNNYSEMSDEGLDSLVLEILHTVQQDRTRETIRRVDPEGVWLRGLQMRIINRRQYRVAGSCVADIKETNYFRYCEM